MYGGQPVFHCRNVVQVNEWRSDGYEDDDENYLDNEIDDVDTCYSECPSGSTLNEDGLVIEESPNRIKIDLLELASSKNATTPSNSKIDSSGRFTRTNECLFNLNKSNAPHSTTTSNKLILLAFLLANISQIL